MTDFDADKLREYRNVLGATALVRLWNDFVFDTEKIFASVNLLNRDEQRLKFHNLRAGALVFGLQAFSVACASLEKAITDGIDIEALAEELQEAKMLFIRQRAKVDDFLE